MRTRIILLGSTGSIGNSALEVVRRYPDRFEIVGLAACSNVEALKRQCAEFRPPCAAIVDETLARDASAHAFGVEKLYRGPKGAQALAEQEADIVLGAMVGAAGLAPVLAAIRSGKRVALANKEPLVSAGALIMEEARRMDVPVIPVDSEHSAIFQCLEGRKPEEVYQIHLTASGGPFYQRKRASMNGISPDEAARHPTWDMGRKISVDSATLMNKGLEIIEAMWLFNAPLDKIEVVIHPQSIVHSLVEFTDGGILAHLGPTDMKFPIQYALTWPERARAPMRRLDLTTMPPLTFAKPDFTEFPCLRLAMEAARRGGGAPAILNAANETAVEAFCERGLPFLKISEVVEAALEHVESPNQVTFESIKEADAAGRRFARAFIEQAGVRV
ncbi:MAG: 1-deoxy-D-xylulose-5-phosphate reductoisomerase [Candidatus Hydrogenedentota bacterium]